MRSALSSHLNEFVLCRGWISFWEEIPEYSTRRVVVSQPTIKKADINLLYKDQKFISTEHHLNLFIKHEDLPNYEIVFELNEIINFTGLVERYTRKDGSEDYGIYANSQSTIPYEIEKLVRGYDDATKSMDNWEKNLDYLKTYAEPKTQDLIMRLKEIHEGENMLPTFHKTHKQYLKQLVELFYDIPESIKSYENYIASRQYRRHKKQTKSNLALVAQMGGKKSKKSIDAINQLKNNLNEGINYDENKH